MSTVRMPASQALMSYLTELNAAASEHDRARMVFDWLCDDTHRPALYAELREREPVLRLQSCAVREETEKEKRRRRTDEPAVYLLTRTADITNALKHGSSAVYQGIGSGKFVLGAEGKEHEDKRQFLMAALKPTSPIEIDVLAVVACHHALIGPLKRDRFDAVTDVCEQAALRFIAAYFGFPDSDHVLLQQSLRGAFDGTIYQMFARHFVFDPAVPPRGQQGMGLLAQRVAQLIKEASTAPGEKELFDVLIRAPEATPVALEAFAREIVTLDGRTKDDVMVFVRDIDLPQLARRTADLLDTLLNYGNVRAHIGMALRTLPDTLRKDLEHVVMKLIRAKQAPDDHLVPRRLLMNGALPEWQDTTGDYRFRKTFIERIARNPGASSILDLAVTTVGAIAGLLTNVIGSAAGAIDQYFRLTDAAMDGVRSRAVPFTKLSLEGIMEVVPSAEKLKPFVREANRLQPSAVFLPRTVDEDIAVLHDGKPLPVGAELLIPLGAVLRDCADPDTFSETGRGSVLDYAFGDLDHGLSSHRCVGEHIGLPLTCHIVRSVLSLPGVARQWIDGEPAKLSKKWGYICESFPLTFDRDQHLAQYSLNVIMTIKHPSAEHAEKLKLLIKYGAPAIEQLLARSRIVHFARFVFLNNDTQLALLTAYDGHFDDYIRHFALAAGPLFDRIFEHIEDAPPRPVREHASKFIEHIRRYDVAPAQGYFFSARPTQRLADDPSEYHWQGRP
jgi:cytochrome P450